MNKPYGYIYKTTNLLTGKFYIGKKNYTFKRRKKLTKKELALITKKGRKPIYKTVETESDWQTYYGSSEELQKDIKEFGKDNFLVQKLMDCYDKSSLTYWEVHFQFFYRVLFVDTYNGQISGKFYKGKIHDEAGKHNHQ